jgi:hypothetical protein
MLVQSIAVEEAFGATPFPIFTNRKLEPLEKGPHPF